MADQHTIEVGEINLTYQVSGPPDAAPLVLLHALGETARSWDTVSTAFSAHWRVYAPDMRGHGGSDWPGNYALELMRADIVGFLDALALERVTMIGHSMGGLVACLLAEDHPDRVRRMVLEDVPVPYPRTANPPTRPDGPQPCDWSAVLAVRAQIDDPDPAWRERLVEITAPTLVVAGGPTSPMPQDRVAELATRIPQADIVTIPAGHRVHDGSPAEFTAAILPFLRSG
jgi:3-oxoadipate enol-lactonase